jgi:hypothetical protein
MAYSTDGNQNLSLYILLCCCIPEHKGACYYHLLMTLREETEKLVPILAAHEV